MTKTDFLNPPPITSEEFDALMYRLYPLAQVMKEHGSRSRPLLALDVASRLWIQAVPENEDTALFRAHMQHLERRGWFYFTDFIEEADRS